MGFGSKGWEVNRGRGDRPHSPYFIVDLSPPQALFQAGLVVQFGCHPEQAFFAQRRACPELVEGT